MNNDTNQPGKSEHTGAIGPDPAGTPAQQADELFVHGLIGSLHERASGVQARRIDRLMVALAETAGAPTGLPERNKRFSGRRLRRLVSVLGLACVGIVGVVATWIVVAPATNEARAAVTATISAAKASGDSRYEIRIMRAMQNELPAEPSAVFDSKSGGLFVLRARGPNGHVAIAGQDAAGEWAIRQDGGIERDDPRRAWPRWATSGDESIFADSVEALLTSLMTNFNLFVLEPQVVDGRTMRRVVGLRRTDPPHGLADRVLLLIDADTKQLQRMEMAWNQPPMGPRGKGPDGPPMGPRPEGGDHPLRDGPPGELVPDDGRPDRGPEGRREGRPDRGPDFGPGRPERDGPRPGPRGEFGPPLGNDGPQGPLGPPLGPQQGPQGQPRGQRLVRLVMERTNAPTWPSDWFTPEGHLSGG